MSTIQEHTISNELLPARLPVVGSIKIGGMKPKHAENDKTYPVRYDHFRVVTRVRGADGNFERDDAVHGVIGDKPTTLDVRLPFDTRGENFYAQMAHYKGRTQQTHRCDGVTCVNPMTDVSRPCDRRKGTECPCKPFGRLSVFLEAAPTVGGLYAYRTTSWDSVIAMQTFLGQLEQDLPLRGLPLRLRLYPAEVTYSDGDAKKVTKVLRVALELRASWDQARAAAIEYHQQNRLARNTVLALAAGTAEDLASIDAEEAGIGEEFFPDAAATAEVGGPAPESKLGQMNRQILDEQVGVLRGLMARAAALKINLALQKDRLDGAIDSQDTNRLADAIVWLTRQVKTIEDRTAGAPEQPSLLED